MRWIAGLIGVMGVVGLLVHCGPGEDCEVTLTCPSSSSSAAGGVGGDGGMSSNTGGSTGGTGGNPTAGGAPSTGGGGAGPCTLGTGDGCPDGQKCTVVDVATPELVCRPAGNLAALSPCNADTECETGTYCDELTGVCEKICNVPNSQSSCGTGWCLDVLYPGFGLCTAGCDPVGPSGCPDASLICAAWFDKGGGETTFHCVEPTADGGGLMEDQICSLALGTWSCAPGLICAFDVPDPICLRWCNPVGGPANCVAKTCVSFPLPFIQNGEEYGGCL